MMKQIKKQFSHNVFLRYVMGNLFSELYNLLARWQKHFGICESPKFRSTQEAKHALRVEGYEFKTLWEDCSPLKPAKIDASFIIPVYNSEKFLEKCLRSILDQETKYTYEVICVNDGSTDGSAEILNNLKETFAGLVIVEQQNQGIAGARNRGLKEANGRYVGFIDNDDCVTPHYVENLLTTAYRTEADMVQCSYKTEEDKGRVIQSVIRENRLLNVKQCSPSELSELVSGFIWSGLIRKSQFDKVRFPLHFWYEDMVTRMLLMRTCNYIALTGDALYYKCEHGANAAKTLWKTGDIRSADQYWLAESFVRYANDVLGMKPDALVYQVLLKEWSYLLYGRTRRLPNDIRRAIFYLCASFVNSMQLQTSDKSFQLVEESFRRGDFKLWQYASQSVQYCAYSR